MTDPASRETSGTGLTDRVLDLVRTDDPRTGALLTALIGHLHEFVRETRPTPDEWRYGLDFLARTGRALRLPPGQGQSGGWPAGARRRLAC